MSEPRVTIIGLGFIGGSIGLALKAGRKQIRIIGHDIDPEKNKLARQKRAVDESSFSLPDACTDADLVVIATPITAIREILTTIAPHLKPGCVVTDTATLKTPVMAWAAEILPEHNPFVGGDPLLNPAALPQDMLAPQGLDSARADLFAGAFYLLCPTPNVAPTAVKRVADMANLLQARPFFTDPLEHDGMRAAVEGLPALVALALMRTVGGAAGWRETRKLADHLFGMASAPLSGDAPARRATLLLNAEHLLPRLQALIGQLDQLRQWLADGDAEALETALVQANQQRDAWLHDRALAEWEEELGELEIPGPFAALANLIGLGRPRPGDKEER